jgi:hypothetical protein
MTRRVRKAKPPAGTLSEEALDRLTYAEQVELARRVLITYPEVNASTARRVRALFRGRDPYAHLRVEWEARADR